MANQYAVNHKKRHYTLPARLTEVATQGGRLRVLYDTFLTDASTLDQTEILFGKLPPGAKVWEFALTCSATLGSNSALQAGYTDATTAFLPSAAATVAGQTRWMKGGGQTAVSTTASTSVISVAPVSITSEVDVVVKYDPSSGTAAASTGVTLSVYAVYTLD